MAAKTNSDKVVVAAIDFGTTFSGYAYSLKHDYAQTPLHISVNQGWNSGSMISLKTSTTLLLKPDQTFDSFGYEAESNYVALAENDDHYKDWYYFRQFKMRLHDTQVKVSVA
jgi:hypothetical protein